MFINKRRTIFFLTLAVVSIVFTIAIINTIYREFASTRKEYETSVKTASADFGYTMQEIQRLSQILILNLDILHFVSQPPIEKGSAKIQALIDAQKHLASAKSVYPAVETIYVYSKNSDYLLEANNAFFSIDQMYSSLFAFGELNSGQWRSTYLLPAYKNTWLVRTQALVNGILRDVIPFVQTLPLANPSANSGKLIILCKATFFDGIIKDLDKYAGSFSYISDSNGKIIYSKDMPVSNTLARSARQNINGKMYQVFVENLSFSNYNFVSVAPTSVFFAGVQPLLVVILLLCVVVFFACALLILIHSRGKSRQIAFDKNHATNTISFSSNHIGKNIPAKDTAFFERVEEYMKNNYQNPLLNLSQMAQDFGTKESFLYHFFISKINASFSQYLENYRLQQARFALESDITTSITKLAENCGYSNSQTFRRAFKKKFGVTPSEYKEQLFCK